MLLKQLFSWLPQLRREIWIITSGRLISQIGHGLLVFSAPIFWVKVVGLSATEMGIGLGVIASLGGIVGRFVGATLTDASLLNSRRTLVLSALISGFADLVMALTHTFPFFILGSLITGLGVGIGWPAVGTILDDLTTTEQCNDAFALNRLADRLGLNVGIFLGGLLVASRGTNIATSYRWFYVADGLTFLVFGALVYFSLPDIHSFKKYPPFRSWTIALSDRCLMVFAVAAIFVTMNIAQIQTTLPLYFTNFVQWGESDQVFSSTIAKLFIWYSSFAMLIQLPLVHFLRRFNRLHILRLALLLYIPGFTTIWLVSLFENFAIVLAIVALGILALALAIYDPLASAFVIDLAPESLRGIYLAINSQSWTIGYAIGPLLGGWVLDHSVNSSHYFGLLGVANIGLALFILRSLGPPTLIRHLKVK
ncbi:MAG: MFS transporter [Crocosphaera sp.]